MSINGWTEGFIPAGDVAIHYWRTANSALPLLVFLHGFFMDGAFMVTPVTPLLSNYSVVLPDGRGHGSTTYPKGTLTIENLVADAAAVIRHVSPNAPVILAGHSMGAATAARVAWSHPDLVRGLLLVEPPWNRPPGAPYSLVWYKTPHQKLAADLLRNEALEFQNLSQSEILLKDKERSELIPPAESSLQAHSRFHASLISAADIEAVDTCITMAVGNLSMPVLLQVGDLETANSTVGSKINPDVAKLVVSTYRKGRLDFFPHGLHYLFGPPTKKKWTEDTLLFLLEIVKGDK